MAQSLDGILVIELGTMITAPLAGMMLADLGARVIKVEHPKGGDPFRAYRGDLYSPHFVAYNRNKESIQLDLQSAAGQEMLQQADFGAPTCCSTITVRACSAGCGSTTRRCRTSIPG